MIDDGVSFSYLDVIEVARAIGSPSEKTRLTYEILYRAFCPDWASKEMLRRIYNPKLNHEYIRAVPINMFAAAIEDILDGKVPKGVFPQQFVNEMIEIAFAVKAYPVCVGIFKEYGNLLGDRIKKYNTYEYVNSYPTKLIPELIDALFAVLGHEMLNELIDFHYKPRVGMGWKRQCEILSTYPNQ